MTLNEAFERWWANRYHEEAARSENEYLYIMIKGMAAIAYQEDFYLGQANPKVKQEKV